MTKKTFTGNEGVREQPANQLWIGLILRNSLRQNAVSISTGATAIPTTALSNRRMIVMLNNSDNIIYIGNSSVSTTTGFPLRPQAVLSLNIEDDVVVYGVSTGTSELRILEGA